MRRRYKVSSFTKLTNYIRDLIPDACIGTDVIVGFPGETEDLFLETYNYIKNSELNYLHVFPYSDRKGTRASGKTDKVDNFDKKVRSKKLRILADKLKEEFHSKYIGKTLLGIKEKNNKVRTRNYIDVNITDTKIEQGTIVKVKIDEILNKKVLGSIIPHQG
jgi:threonylcarbamoyladenosine tRNA methylthiotransferase MtaB